MNQHYTAHLLQWKKKQKTQTVGKFPSFWSHLSPCNLLCYTLYVPFLPLRHCTLPISSLITLSPSLLSLSLCPLFGSHPLLPLNSSLLLYLSYPLLYLLFALSLICFSVFISAGTCLHSKWGALTRDVVFKTEWGYPSSHEIRSEVMLPPLPLYPLSLRSVSLHGRKVGYAEHSNPIWCCVQLLNLDPLRGVCRFQQVKFKEVKTY